MDEKLKRLFAEIFELDEELITDDTAMEGVERWDSLSHMRLIVSIEEELGIKLSPDDMTRMTSFGEIRRIAADKA